MSTDDGTSSSQVNEARRRMDGGKTTDSDSLKGATKIPSTPQPTKRKQFYLTEYLAQRQKPFCLYVLGALAICHQFRSLRPYTNKFLYLQYVDPISGYSSIGKDDVYFVITWIVLLTLIRVSIMDYVYLPVAKLYKISSKKRSRFAEQGWSFSYYLVSWIAGMALMHHADYAFSVKHFWMGWPHYNLQFYMKAYYLIQLSCWLSQIYVLNVEEKRKDYSQMFTHHIITCLLVIGSYYFFYFAVGHAIMAMMDVLDALLALAKMTKYMGYTTLCDAIFLLFLFCWVIFRHGLYNYITYSAIVDAPNLIPYKCFYDGFGQHKRCFTPTVYVTFVSLLVLLQIIMLIWFYMILKIVVKVIKGEPAEDNRSDDEDGDDDEYEKKQN